MYIKHCYIETRVFGTTLYYPFSSSPEIDRSATYFSQSVVHAIVYVTAKWPRWDKPRSLDRSSSIYKFHGKTQCKKIQGANSLLSLFSPVRAGVVKFKDASLVAVPYNFLQHSKVKWKRECKIQDASHRINILFLGQFRIHLPFSLYSFTLIIRRHTPAPATVQSIR